MEYVAGALLAGIIFWLIHIGWFIRVAVFAIVVLVLYMVYWAIFEYPKEREAEFELEALRRQQEWMRQEKIRSTWYGRMRCLNCDYEWTSRRPTPPKKCHICGSQNVLERCGP